MNPKQRKMMDLSIDRFQYKGRSDRGMVHGFGRKLEIHSMTRQGKIYIDGEHIVYPAGLGSKIDITLGDRLTLIGNLEEKREKYVSK